MGVAREVVVSNDGRIVRVATAALVGLALGCASGPSGPLDHQVWVLVAVNNQPLPAMLPGIIYPVVADTLEFNVESSRWRPRPLARASRWLQIVSEHGNRNEEIWYTYDAAGSSEFTIRALCADGDLASCIDGNGTGAVAGTTLVLSFNSGALGQLRYQRLR